MKALLFLYFGVIIVCRQSYGQTARMQSLQQLIDAENGFATLAEKASFKIAFLKNLDSTGIVFNGREPVNGISFYNSQPDNNALLFKWYPVHAELSANEDMGFTTGPYILISNKSKDTLAAGNYFSIWKKDRAGMFRVLLDGGIRHTNNAIAARFGNLQPASVAGNGKLGTGEAGSKNFNDTDAEFLKLADVNMMKAYEAFMSVNSYVLRSDLPDGEGKAAYLQTLKGQAVISAKFNNRGVVQSANNGFCYTYGTVQLLQTNGKDRQGYFVHVWQFQSTGCKIIADVLQLINN